MGVQAAATAIEGTTLVLPEYTVPVDGLLVVRVGTQGGVSDSVTFDGVEMMEAASSEVLFFPWTVSSEVRYLDVEEGESGPIVVRYGHSGRGGSESGTGRSIGEPRRCRLHDDHGSRERHPRDRGAGTRSGRIPDGS
jgi:hypothetical protein